MKIGLPEKEKILWTSHSKSKLRQYNFSGKRVLSIFRKPDRVEEARAPNTISSMQITGSKSIPLRNG